MSLNERSGYPGIILVNGKSYVKPTIQLFPAQNNYETAVVVSLRGDSDMFNVQAQSLSTDNDELLRIIGSIQISAKRKSV